MRTENGVQGALVGQIRLHQQALGYRIAIAAGQVIEDNGLVPSFEQHLHHMGADVARTANDQYFHFGQPQRKKQTSC